MLELKTGKPAPEHEQQLAIYLTAARALFPGASVDGNLVYALVSTRHDRETKTGISESKCVED